MENTFADGDGDNWHESFRLSYSNGRPLEFLKGMFYQELSKTSRATEKVK